jgi:UDPglucose 6-dehydrogenase
MELKESLKVSIIGSGYVGLVTGVALAELGHDVLCMDIDKAKIAKIDRGDIPIYEPGLDELLIKNRDDGRLRFSSSIKEAVDHGLIIFIAVGTPSKSNGEADLSYVDKVAQEIALNMDSYRLIVEKSTVPVETGQKVKQAMQLYVKGDIDFDVASNPEFLREGSALYDFFNPDRIVIGVDSPKARDLLFCLYSPLASPVIVTDIKSAELIKHASNSFLALKISFINAISRISEMVGADVDKIAEGMGMDKRIGRIFLDAGVGYGGSCFPKDVDAFIHISEALGYDFKLLKEVKKINEYQRKIAIDKIKEGLWILKDKKIVLWGASFKPETDDIRGAPSIDIIETLLKEDAKVTVVDPQALGRVEEIFKDKIDYEVDKYKAAEDSDCVLILTEWDDFKDIDFKRLRDLMRVAFIVDGRNIYKHAELGRQGFLYIPFGSPAVGRLVKDKKAIRQE